LRVRESQGDELRVEDRCCGFFCLDLVTGTA
jgi:hypothetical protein